MKSSTNINDLFSYAKKYNIKLDYVVSRNNVINVCSSNKLPLNIIINLEDSKHKGTHWVAARILANEILYFDSFGQLPIMEILELRKSVIYSDYEIQHINQV